MPHVVIPWRGGCAHRERALEHVLGRYQWPVTVAEAPAGLWVKANAVMPAVAHTDAEIVVVADADVWCEGLHEAVEAVERGMAWAVPHYNVFRLSEASTQALYEGADPKTLDIEQNPYPGIEGGGVVVARRETLLEIPLDSRFIGWGQEDRAWGVALTALLGPPWRGEVPLYHLWHPHPERLTRTRGSREGWQLRTRYFHARYDPDAMRALIEEAHVANSPDEPTLHHYDPLGVD